MLVYCSNCGEKLAEDAYFCSKCGTKTPVGKAAKASYPADELRDTFYNVGLELEKAFTLAAKETHAAFKRATENVQQKTAAQGLVSCPKCKAKNPMDAIFCSNCGTKLAPA
jgi:uncharacterized membrane protein YvbJ